MKLSPEVLHSVVALGMSHDFGVLMRAIASHTSTLNEAHIKKPVGDEYLRGKVAAYSEFLETVNGAGKQLERAGAPKT